MKINFYETMSFKLILLLFIIITALFTTSYMFNSKIDKLKLQIDNIYFGNFVPVLKLQNVEKTYTKLLFCKKSQSDCDKKNLNKIVNKNWNYYFKAYKNDKERLVVNKIDIEIKKSFLINNDKIYKKMLRSIIFLIDYEIEAAYKQRKEFLVEYKNMKDYLMYNLVILLVFSFAIIFSILYSIVKKDKQLKILNKKYKIDSITDSMTTLYNRKHFDTIFDKLPTISALNNWQSAFIMFDIDFFKQYNDTYGHDMGDKALISVASLLKTYFNKDYEYVFRLGGEEFGTIIFDTDIEIIRECLSDINKKIVELKIEHKSSKVLDVLTISIGAIIYDSKFDLSSNQMYKLADENLYKSKENGRNTYTI